MCYNISLRRIQREMEEYYHRVCGEDADFIQYYSVSGFVHPQLPVILSENPAVFSRARWGLIPAWVKSKEDAKISAQNCLNAKGETVFKLPSFRSAIKKRRCIIPVTGFFEWMEFNKAKYPHHIAVKDEPYFSLGGIYEEWTDKETGEIIRTFSIVTTAANELMEKIHNVKKRMPLIIPKENTEKWLDASLHEDEVAKLIAQFPSEKMHVYTISKRITSRKEDPNSPETLELFEYPELALL